MNSDNTTPIACSDIPEATPSVPKNSESSQSSAATELGAKEIHGKNECTSSETLSSTDDQISNLDGVVPKVDVESPPDCPDSQADDGSSLSQELHDLNLSEKVPGMSFNSAISNRSVNRFPVDTTDFIDVGVDGLVKMKVLRTGDGSSPTPGGLVGCEYVGFVANSGVEFDRSLPGYDFKFTLGHGKVLAGWERGINSMKLGEVAQLWIDSSLGYGDVGSGDDIPPNTDLVFLIHLCSSTGSEGGRVDKESIRQNKEIDRLQELRIQREAAAEKRKADKEARDVKAMERSKQIADKLAAKNSKGKQKSKKQSSK